MSKEIKITKKKRNEPLRWTRIDEQLRENWEETIRKDMCTTVGRTQQPHCGNTPPEFEH
jgi:hypothetical protein